MLAVGEAARRIGTEHLQQLVEWVVRSADTARVLDQLARLDVASVRRLNTLVGATALKAARIDWISNRDTADVGFWQAKLREHAFVLSQVFSVPVLVQEQAYVGGKRVEGVRGSVLDYLVKNRLTHNAALVEIKNPQTPLLGRQYREDVYGPSVELAGAVQQVANSRHTLLSEYYILVGVTLRATGLRGARQSAPATAPAADAGRD